MIHVLFCISLTFLFLNTANGDTVHRRGDLPVLHGELLSGGKNGLLFSTAADQGSSILIPWSEVESIQSEIPSPTLEKFLLLGEDLWLSKQRLIRGDIKLAEASFREMHNQFQGNSGKDARLATEGYLRILLSKGDLQNAIIPWLEIVRHSNEGTPSSFNNFPSIIDLETNLCPDLPVIVLDLNPLIFKQLKKTTPETEKLVLDILSSNNTDPEDESSFLKLVSKASSGKSDAIKLLELKIPEFTDWKIAWAHFALAKGKSRISPTGINDDSLLHYAHVASMDPTQHPFLSGLAMIYLSNYLKEQGNEQQANRIKMEAQRLFPLHPNLTLLEGT